MSPHNNFKGPEHARPWWALQVALILVGVGTATYVIGLLLGWWPCPAV